MDEKANIVAQTQTDSKELRRDSINENMRRGSRLLDDVVPISPRFVISPKDVYIFSTQTGTIETRIYSVPKPIVRWYKNGQLITSSLFPKIKKYHCEPERYVLEIPDAIVTDMGTYTCVARNCYGSITASVSLRIIDLETEEHPRFVKRLKRTDIVADSNSHLEVRVSGVPKPEIEWLKDSMPLKQSKRIEICHKEPRSYVLRFRNAQPADAGLYTCKATNAVGTSSTSAMVYVDKIEGLNEKWQEDLACGQLEKYQCPNGWSQKEMDDYMYRITIANYHIKYRTPIPGYSNIF